MFGDSDWLSLLNVKTGGAQVLALILIKIMALILIMISSSNFFNKTLFQTEEKAKDNT